MFAQLKIFSKTKQYNQTRKLFIEREREGVPPWGRRKSCPCGNQGLGSEERGSDEEFWQRVVRTEKERESDNYNSDFGIKEEGEEEW